MKYSDVVIPIAVNAVHEVVTDPKRKAKWRLVLLEVFTAIAQAFQNDDAFKAVTTEKGKVDAK